MMLPFRRMSLPPALADSVQFRKAVLRPDKATTIKKAAHAAYFVIPVKTGIQ
jgi:hypothetical protein